MYFADKSKQSLKKRLFWTPLLPALKVIMMHGAMAAFLKLYKAKKMRHKNKQTKKKVFLNKKKDLSAYEYDIIPIYLKTKWHL